MRKIFLSHSSKDKVYVEIVAKYIGIDNCVYDKFTFEEGMQTLSEIYKGLDMTDIFVLFISDKSLDSKWVKRELKNAKKLFEHGNISRLYPIIIDDRIKYDDYRIPVWLQEKYNIRYIASPKIAANKIKARMRELYWDSNPNIKRLKQFFVGRNDEIKLFEERTSDLDRPKLKCLNASSGFVRMGRKAFMKHVLKRGSIMNESYEYNLITLEQYESIEDFIIKIADLGVGNIDITKLSSMPEDEKIDIAAKIIMEIQAHREFIFINDNGVIIKPDSKMADWFCKILNSINEQIVFGIASIYRLHLRGIYDDPFYIKSLGATFSIQIKELSVSERKLLLLNYCKINNLDIDIEHMKIIASNLSGYPVQVLYLIQTIKDEGIERVMRNLHEIKDYSDSMAQKVFEKYADTDLKKDFLVFLASFDFVNYEILDQVYQIEPEYKNFVDTFISVSICEFMGADGEYIAVNDVLKDIIFRRKLSMGNKLANLFAKLVDKTVNDDFINTTDLAGYYSVVRAKLEKALEGENNNYIDDKYIIPSHYLKCIVKKYNSKNYDKALKLCKKIIEGGRMANFDSEIKIYIYYYYCQSLAREHKRDEFFEAVNYKDFKAEDRYFLLGFYYRINGNPEKAIEFLTKALDIRADFPRARRELANAYLMSEDYESAEKLCIDNYNTDNRNLYYIQPYFEVIIHKYFVKDNHLLNKEVKEDMRHKLLELLNAIKNIDSQQSKEMFILMEAEYYAYIERDFDKALEYLQQKISDVQDSIIYLYLARFDIAYNGGNSEVMRNALDDIEKQVKNQKYFSNAMYLRKARYFASIGEYQKSIDILQKLKNMPQGTIEKFTNEINK